MNRLYVFAAVFLILVISAMGGDADRFDITIDVPGRGNVSLRLAPQKVFTHGSRIQCMTANGEVSVSPSFMRVYRGSLPNETGSIVVMMVTPQGVQGRISLGSEMYDVRRAASASAPVIVTQRKAGQLTCSTSEDNIPANIMQLMHEKPAENPQDAETLELQLAIEADYNLFKRFNFDRAKALAYISLAIATVSEIYERELNVRVVVSNMRLWEAAADPYSDSENAMTLWREFASVYEQTMGHVQRDAAVFLTMRSNFGGTASNIGGICEPGANYCVCDIVGDLPRHPSEGSWAFDEIIISHELGHVCGGLHTHNCFWPGGPLDSCVQSEVGSCVRDDQTRWIFGTLMSYCDKSDGGGIALQFHDRQKPMIRAYLERASCVGARPAVSNAVLKGRLINKRTNQGIAGAILNIHTFHEYPGFLGAVPPNSDTTAITSADGSYVFRGLTDGVYTVVFPSDLAPYPFTTTGAEQGVGIAINEDTVRQDFGAVPGRPLSITYETDSDSAEMDVFLISDSLELLTAVFSIPEHLNFYSRPFIRTVPFGSYTIVPHSIGRSFSPLKIEVEITADKPLTEVVFGSKLTTPDETAPLVVVTTVTDQGVRRLLGNTMITVTNEKSSEEYSASTSAKGVAVFEDLDIANRYTVRQQVDTNNWVPIVAALYGRSTGDWYPPTLGIRRRRMPLVANPYELEVTQGQYTPLVGAERISSLTDLRLNRRLELPRTFQVAAGTTPSRVFVYADGEVVFSHVEAPLSNPTILSGDEADFVVAPFSSFLIGDSADPDQSGVWVLMEGEHPNSVLSVEWRNLKSWQCDGTGCEAVGSFNFQVRIDERTGTVIMSYGLIDPILGWAPASIGLRGADYLDTRLIAFGVPVEDWSNPGTTTDSPLEHNLRAERPDVPPNGLTYRWFNPATDVASDATTSSALTIAPQPANDELAIRGLPQGSRLRLVDVLGRTVLSMNDAYTNTRLSVSSIPTGRYSLLVDSESGTSVHAVMVAR